MVIMTTRLVYNSLGEYETVGWRKGEKGKREGWRLQGNRRSRSLSEGWLGQGAAEMGYFWCVDLLPQRVDEFCFRGGSIPFAAVYPLSNSFCYIGVLYLAAFSVF